ncbi:Radical SAM domain protein [Candidatus Accumulibacter aalborgensis]|uniref:Radical SAM domain protein n=1 Tax=Candidatus Accumulibacter aalborgensis TaxID=1860102 RepID=A0A1A8XHT1_9PROT|nr:radical SAM protein [Candidatus Accumulibacter aalborgensis]SBT04715.1 Radical SAM domain protein [Candidatus Accumulibacter aalborgensis]
MSGSVINVVWNAARRQVGVALREHPEIRDGAAKVETWMRQQEHTAARFVPGMIRPRPYLVMIAITGYCNLRCQGCRYGRDFMPGTQLSWDLVKGVLDDVKAAGIYKVRLYGGEPLLHPDLARMVAYCRELGLVPGITTNAVALSSQIDELYRAGLRDISIGFYGRGSEYDEYTERPGRSRKMEDSIAAVRGKYGDQVHMQINWLLRRQTCDLRSLHEAFDFAQKYGTTLQIDLVHYSLPYFTEGPDRFLQFRPEDRPAIDLVVAELLRLKANNPQMIRHTPEAIRAMPDWLLLGPAMKVPCTAREMLWVGPDGSVQLCYVTFKLGNLHERRLSEMLYTAEHKDAARRAFALDCPNCHCSAGDRIMRDAASRRKYAE